MIRQGLVGAVAVVALVSLPLITVLVICAVLDRLWPELPPTCGWPDCEAPECQAGADEEEHEGERVGPDLGPEEPQQGQDGRGHVADECDHGHSLPRLRLV